MLFIPTVFGAFLPSECQRPGVLALTFEEGPIEYTETILSILRKNNIKATFHFNAIFRTPSSNSIILQAYKDGHDVGLRTNPKRDYFQIESESLIEEDLDAQVDYLQTVIDDKIKYARSPLDGTRVNEIVYQYFVQNKIIQTNYSFCPYDSEMNPSDALEDHLAVCNPSFDSQIISLYESRLEQDEELQQIINVIKNKGFSFVTLSGCLPNYKPGDNMSTFESNSKSSDNIASIVNNSFMIFVTYYLL
ncbi:hypothetical protein NUSPORA_01539 [Nucleospora cyclopteri]